MSTRSITPETSCSEPMGISVATTCGPKAALRLSSVRKKSARSRSSMLTKIRRARSSSAARCHRRLAWTSTPMTALITNTADSHTRSAPSASATKLASPGVSIRLTLRSCHSKLDRAAEIDIWRAFSSGSESETVVPSITEPIRLIAPAWNSSASCSEVLPPPRWPTSATLRIRSAGLCMPVSSPSVPEGATIAVGGPPAASVQLVGQLGAQAQHGLGVQLGDARLGDPEHLADLAQGQVLVVVEGHHELLALGQRRDGVGDPVAQLRLVHELLRVGGVAVGQGVQQRDLVAG